MGVIVSFKHGHICTQLLKEYCLRLPNSCRDSTAVPKKLHTDIAYCYDHNEQQTHVRPIHLLQQCMNNPHLKRLERGTYSFRLIVFEPKCIII